MKSVVLVCYNRPQKTQEVLDHLKKAKDVSEYLLVVVRQFGDDEDCLRVKELIDGVDWMPVNHLETKPLPTDPTEKKIATNILTGFEHAFDVLHSKWVLLLEDDICVGYDIFPFIETVLNRYDSDPLFRAVNCFSNEPLNSKTQFLYSKFRFGVGNGWAITKKKWDQIFKESWPRYNGDCLPNKGFDAHIETKMKMGYVVMPYAARSLDIGWGEKAFTSGEEQSESQIKNQKSFVGTSAFELRDYGYSDKYPYSHRSDCKRYRWYTPLLYSLFRLKRKIAFLYGYRVKEYETNT